MPTGKNTTPYGLPYPTDRWENWWVLNQDAFLDLTRVFASRSRGPETSGDEFLGVVVPPPGSHPVFLHRTEVRARLVPLLAAHLDDSNAIVRGEAALALGKIGGADVLPRLEKATQDGNRFVRQLALLGMGLTREADAVRFLAGFVLDNSQQDSDRAYAALALAVIGDVQALPALATTLHRSGVDRSLEASALYALGFLKCEDAVILLREYTQGSEHAGDLRAAATSALGKQAQPSLVPAMLALLEDAETQVRRSAALALGQVPFESKQWARRDALLEKLRYWNETSTLTPEARRRFEEHVSEIEHKAVVESRSLQDLRKKVVQGLAMVLDHDRDRMARYFAALSLGRIASPEAHVELARAWRKISAVDAGRGFLAIALGAARAKEASILLRRGLEQKGLDPSTRGAIMVALGLLDDQAVGESLVTYATGDGDPSLRANGALGAGLMNFRAAREPFRKLLKDGAHSFLRPAFGLALALLADVESLDVIEGQALDQESSAITRVYACQALASIHDFASVNVLSRLLAPGAKNTDLVRATALHALGQVAEKTPLPGLEPLARDWNYLLPFNIINDAVLR